MSPITFGLDGSFDIDLGGGYALDNTDSDINEYGFGQPSPYGNKGMISASFEARASDLREQAERAESNSLRMLEDAMKKSAYVTPEQGIASAILAAIPTLGGYMIGKSVGTPDLPAGYFEAGGKRSDIPGYDEAMIPEFAAGLSGTKVGLGSADSYLKGLEADQAQANDVKQKMAGIYTNQATKLDAQAAQLENAALNKQAEIDMIPIREASQMRLQENQGRITADRQFELQSRNADRERIPASILAKIERGEPVTEAEFAGLQPEAIRAITNLKEANRRALGQDIRLSGENLIPPSTATKAKMDSVMQTKVIGERYINHLSAIGQKDPSLLTRTVDSVLPQTELGKLQQDMSLFAVQVRNARENGVMTEPDFQRYLSYLTISPLDTIESVLGRMQELQAVTDLSAQATLRSARLGRENVSEYEKYFGITPSNGTGLAQSTPTPLPQGIPSPVGQTAQTGSPTGTPTQGRISGKPQRSQFSSTQEYVNAMKVYNSSLRGIK